MTRNRAISQALALSEGADVRSVFRRSVRASLARRFEWRGGAFGFTLTELLVALAVISILMLGVTQVFRYAGDSVSAGQSLSAGVRDARAAQAVFARDFANYASDSPALIIRSRVQTAWRNPSDERGETSGDIMDITLGPGDVFNSTFVDVNRRVHRLDDISFFARGLYQRQTANAGQLVADQSSLEAWVHYGHLILPHTNGNFYLDGATSGTRTNPGVGDRNSNPLNFFANQWILGRVAILLVEPDPMTGRIDDQPPPLPSPPPPRNQQRYFHDPNPASQLPLSPLQFNSRSTNFSIPENTPPTPPVWRIQSARYDLAATSIDGYREILLRYLRAGSPLGPWYLGLMGQERFEVSPLLRAFTNPAGTSYDPDATSYAVAQQAPIFVPGCSQFIVEFAGDFLTQNADGTVTNNVPDGQIDFVIVNGVRQVRWYGFPRDTSNASGVPIPDGVIRGDQGDTVPLYDVLASGGFPPAPVEREAVRSVANPIVPLNINYRTVSGLSVDSRYTVAWGPEDANRPKMIRIVLAIEDAGDRLQEPQTFEYVFSLN